MASAIGRRNLAIRVSLSLEARHSFLFAGQATQRTFCLFGETSSRSKLTGQFPDVLRLAEVPEPEPHGERDVKVRLRTAGVNLGRAAGAQRALEAGQVTGKAVLTMDS